jgi:hypothetical protein
MRVTKLIILQATLLFISGNMVCGQGQVPGDFCITAEEFRLYQLVNAHRVAYGQKTIPLSASLSYVARTHVIDLYTHHPDTGICNLNSWSDRGDWTPCCHNIHVPQEECIRNKPKEIASYPGEGYELTYAEVFDTNADTVFRFWTKIDEANNFLLNRANWEKKNWRAMGVGIYKSYAVLWMGQRTDAMPAPEHCRDEGIRKPVAVGDIAPATMAELVSTPTNRFYIIIASFQSEADARREAEKHGQVDGSRIKILRNPQGQYRVSIIDHESLEEARQSKEKYGKLFSGAWILNF